MEEKVGIVQTLELMEGLKIIGEAIAKTVKDGKVNMADLPHLIELIKEFNVIVEAIGGVAEIPAELKDVDQAELLQMGGKAYEVVKAIVDAYKA